MTARNEARTEARASGQLHYMGKPCQYGHAGLRFTSNACCVDCHAAWRVANQDKVKAHRAKWQAREAEAGRNYYRANREKILGQAAAWRALNRDKIRETRRRWRARNLAKVNAHKRTWRAARKEQPVP